MSAGFELADRIVRFWERYPAGKKRALFLTFNFEGPAFFERLWKPVLAKARFGLGPRDIAVVCDGRFPGHRRYGDYELGQGAPLPIRTVLKGGGGAMHAKLALITSGPQWLLVIGSANLSAGGFGGNLEMCQSFSSDEPRDETLGYDARRFLEALGGQLHCTDRRNPWSSDNNLVRLVCSVLPIGPTRRSGSRLLNSLAVPLSEQIRELAGPARSLWAVSPIHIGGESAEEELQGGAVPDLMRVLGLDANRTRFYTDFGGHEPFLPRGAHGVEVWQRKRPLNEESEGDSRTLHAKLYLARSADGDHLFWGSANLTRRALFQTAKRGGNVELLVHQKGQGFAETLGLRPLFARVDKFAAEIPVDVPRDSGGPVMLSAEANRDPRGLILKFNKAAQHPLRLWLDARQPVSLGPVRETMECGRRELQALGCRDSNSVPPCYLNYSVANGEHRLIEILWNDIAVKGSFGAEPGSDALENMLALVSPARRRATPEGRSGESLDTSAGEAEEEIGFTEHDGELHSRYQMWRDFFRRLLALRNGAGETYEAHLQESLKIMAASRIPLGQLAFACDVLGRESFTSEDLANRQTLAGLREKVTQAGRF